MTPKTKKLILMNTPYVLMGLMATKLGLAWRMAEGTNATERMTAFIAALGVAFSSPLPSIHPLDLFIGLLAALALRFGVYMKGKNAKKYRKNIEYGAARWGTAADIAPYTDPKFENNIIFTQTESLTMSSRPSDPKTARNKNVLVISGSGSGKTRFFIKPNIMQCVSDDYPCSFVVTDPKGYTLARQNAATFA